MAEKTQRILTRREFAQSAALLSATASLATGTVLNAAPSAPAWISDALANAANLSPEGQAEADARFQQIIAQYGSRFTADEKTMLQKICFDLQPSLDRVRAYPLNNGDTPALYLKPLVEREKKPPAGPPAPVPVGSAKKP
jgi:hypothetical protein